ncbi:glycosyltransferase family 4 protein [Finegoldia magna]|uniref:glycosyltransferase family 4 protein n=1 Tax=Finegoldia magna TaxID=1260 RepID=UPI003F800692
MKILIVCQSYYPEQFKITDIAEELVEQGNDVTVYTGLPNYPEGKIYEGYKHHKNRIQLINGVKIKRSWLIERGHSKVQLFLNYISFMLSSSVRSILDKEDYDVVISYQLSPISMVVPAIIATKKRNIKHILYCLDLWPASLYAGGLSNESLLYKFIGKFSKKIYQSADKICVSSPSFIDYLSDVHNVKSSNITVLYNYAEDIFQPIEENSYDNVTDIMFAGNIGKMQSVNTIIEAANILKENENILFHIVGDGSEYDNINHLIDQYKLTNVRIYGRKPLSEMPKFYSMADAMIISLARHEIISYTIPNKLQSYLAMGKPIIGSIDGQVNKIIQENNIGFTSNSENAEKLAENILRFSKLDRKQISKLKQNSLRFYNDNFSKDKFYCRLNRLLEETTNVQK